ncbi:MAG: exonuclease SbcCD subunit D [Propionibacteriaceae bacterium]|nr:exonuclease SbcCD subunit D [Propionibacteriaceae bacterium]
MKIIHSSDWHLGRTLHGVELLEYQAGYLDHLVELVRESRPDALLVAGDIFDRAIPPVEAVRLLSDTLRRLAGLTQVVITSGNHDSAARLGYGAAVMRSDLHVVTNIAQVGTPVEIVKDARLAGLVYPLPFLVVDEAVEQWSSEAEPLPRSHEAVLSRAMALVRADAAKRMPVRPVPVAVMAHAFVSGGKPSESERDITVGGVDSVSASVFAGVDYLALGHLHRPQRVETGNPAEVARYAGSPLAYSFSEAGQQKSSVIVELGGAQPRVELVPAPVPRKLGEVSGSLAELSDPALDPLRDCWMRVQITDAVRPQHLTQAVKQLFPQVLLIQHSPPERESVRISRVTSALDPLAVAGEFIEYVSASPPTEPQLTALRDALETVRDQGSQQ